MVKGKEDVVACMRDRGVEVHDFVSFEQRSGTLADRDMEIFNKCWELVFSGNDLFQ